MVRVVQHLSLDELRAARAASDEPTKLRHLEVILLLAEGQTVSAAAAQVGFAPRWVEEVLARYNAHGPSALGDQRRNNGARPRLLTPAVIADLRRRIASPPEGGGAWTSRKVAELIAVATGRASVAPQRGWEALRIIARLAAEEAEAGDAEAARSRRRK